MLDELQSLGVLSIFIQYARQGEPDGRSVQFIRIFSNLFAYSFLKR